MQKVYRLNNHPKFRKPRLFIPDRPRAQLSRFRRNGEMVSEEPLDRIDQLVARALKVERAAARVETEVYYKHKEAEELLKETEDLWAEVRLLWDQIRFETASKIKAHVEHREKSGWVFETKDADSKDPYFKFTKVA